MSFRTAVQQIDGQAQASGFRVVADRLDEATAPEWFTARLAGFFGGLAPTLSGLGLFRLMSFTVSRRTREIGIRLALGAPLRDILGMVVGEGWCCGSWGVRWVGGRAGSGASGRGGLYGVATTDPLTHALAAGGLLLIAGLACVRPAWRATRIDPAETLRAE